MKHTILTTIALFALGCNSGQDLYTFKAIVNGGLFESTTYLNAVLNQKVKIVGRDDSGNQMSIEMDEISTGTYPFNASQNTFSYIRSDGTVYSSDDNTVGSYTILEWDPLNRILVGTFEADISGNLGGTILITNGAFEVRYIN